MKHFSEIKVQNFSAVMWALSPCQIYINNTLVWDENDEEICSLELFNYIATLEDIVYSIKIDIIHFHHSIIYLEVENNEHFNCG